MGSQVSCRLLLTLVLSGKSIYLAKQFDCISFDHLSDLSLNRRKATSRSQRFSQQAWSDGLATCPPTIHRVWTLISRVLGFNIIRQVNMFSAWSISLLNQPLIKEVNAFPSWLGLADCLLLSTLHSSNPCYWLVLSHWLIPWKPSIGTHRPFTRSDP